MEEGRASQTALEVAIRRAAHQVFEGGSVLEDPIALPILDPHSRSRAAAWRGRVAPGEASARAWMAVRSRIAEEGLARAVENGVDQYVLLGAGLDTFAYRNPYRDLRVFEVDHPDTQAWKRTRLKEGNVPVPSSVVYAAVDFERHSLREELESAGFDFGRPAFFTWLGVVMYLTPEAFRATASTLGSMPEGSGVALDYIAARETLGLLGKIVFDALKRRVGALGEPFALPFTPSAMHEELRGAGFSAVEDWSSEAIAARYLSRQPGAYWLRRAGLGRMVTAWR